MSGQKDLYQQLLEQGFPKKSIHKVLHHLVLEGIKNGTLPKPGFISRMKHFFCFKIYTYKPFYFFMLLKGKALAMFKSQFAKKPKNPV